MPSSTAKSANTDPGWLLHELTQARVLADDRVQDLWADFHAAPWASRHAVGLAEFLVQAGLLTPFQAERALAGQARTLAVGPYLLLEPVGSGSLGIVYRALHRETRKRFAVKILPLRSMWNVLRAKKQVEVFHNLPPHPAVVPFVDIDTASGSHYLAWPFVEGETFDQLVRRAGALPPTHVCRFMVDVADGLAVCHDHDIIHGLLKPSNLMLGPDRRPRILDLGVGAILSENIADDESLLDTISTANAAMSSLDCAAPETLADPTVRTKQGDIYSLGCVLYYLLTGFYPFPDGNAVDKIIAHQTKQPQPMRSRNSQIPQTLADLVEQMLQKRPEDRPSDLATIRDALVRGSTDASATVAPLVKSPEDVEPPQSVPLSQLVNKPRPPILPVPPTPAPRDKSGESFSFSEPDLEGMQPTLLPGVDTPRNMVGGKSRSKSPLPSPVVPEDLPPVPVNWQPAQPVASFALPKVQVPPIPRLGSGFHRFLRFFCFWMVPRDTVQLSLFGPPSLSPGQTFRFQVYVHPPEAFASVHTLSRAFRPDTELLAAGFVPKLVKRGEELGLHLLVTNAGVAQSLVRFRWVGQTRPWAFEVYVPWESPAGQSEETLTVGLNNVEMARIPFHMVISSRIS